MSAGVYENFIRAFLTSYTDFLNELDKKLNKLSFNQRFSSAYDKTVLELMTEISKEVESFERDPENSVINKIDESEINLKFKENLDYEYLKREFTLNDSFFISVLNLYKKDISLAKENSLVKIQKYIQELSEKIDDIEQIKTKFASI